MIAREWLAEWSADTLWSSVHLVLTEQPQCCNVHRCGAAQVGSQTVTHPAGMPDSATSCVDRHDFAGTVKRGVQFWGFGTTLASPMPQRGVWLAPAPAQRACVSAMPPAPLTVTEWMILWTLHFLPVACRIRPVTCDLDQAQRASAILSLIAVVH